MRTSLLALAALSQVGNVVAFPAVAEAITNDLETRGRGDQVGGFEEPPTHFDPKDQHVSISGKHRFIPPNFNKGDQRGPCPGLNAMANHGYLPRNGIGGAADFLKGTFDVFGMGADLATVLTTIGQVIDGDGLKWSIGGPSKFLPAPLPILGTPQGISGSHNKYEADASPGRGDLYTHGNDYSLQLDQFKELYEMGQKNGDVYSLEVLQAFRSKRFDHSVANNPYFFNGPFSGILVQPAAYEFIYRFMSNKSYDHPHGQLDGKVLRTFFGVTIDKNGEFHHKQGHESIPYNWYKRAKGDAYTQTRLNEDTLTAAVKYPKFISVGGNTGKVNTFQGVNLAELTKGVYNSKDLLKGNNLACFALGFQAQASPDLVECSNVLNNLTDSVGILQKTLGGALTKLSCPKLTKIDKSQFKTFPGYAKLNCKTGKYGPSGI